MYFRIKPRENTADSCCGLQSVYEAGYRTISSEEEDRSMVHGELSQDGNLAREALLQRIVEVADVEHKISSPEAISVMTVASPNDPVTVFGEAQTLLPESAIVLFKTSGGALKWRGWYGSEPTMLPTVLMTE